MRKMTFSWCGSIWFNLFSSNSRILSLHFWTPIMTKNVLLIVSPYGKFEVKSEAIFQIIYLLFCKKIALHCWWGHRKYISSIVVYCDGTHFPYQYLLSICFSSARVTWACPSGESRWLKAFCCIYGHLPHNHGGKLPRLCLRCAVIAPCHLLSVCRLTGQFNTHQEWACEA